MNDTERIRTEVRGRSIHRLCHFTPSRSVAHILANGPGLLASSRLCDDERAVFNPTDLDRLDGHPGHVCCSIEFPNAWNFKAARDKEAAFPDWVVLYLRPHYLWQPGTRFCQVNAARGKGCRVEDGFDAFHRMFEEPVEGAGTFRRGPAHPPYLPTDEQAEVLVPDSIARADILGVAVRDEGQAKRQMVQWRMLRVDGPPVFLVPEFYRPGVLSNLVRAGRRPEERLWRSEENP